MFLLLHCCLRLLWSDTVQPRRQSPRPRAMPLLDQPCPSNRSRIRLSSELPDSIVEHQSRTSLRSSQDDGVGRARVCVNCRVYEPFQNITDICCLTLHGASCVFRDADANNDEADPDSDSEDSGPIELEEDLRMSTHVAQVLSNVMKNRGKSPDAQVEPQSHTGHCSSATAKAPVTAICTPSNEDPSSGKRRPMANEDFERRVNARIDEERLGIKTATKTEAAAAAAATAMPPRCLQEPACNLGSLAADTQQLIGMSMCKEFGPPSLETEPAGRRDGGLSRLQFLRHQDLLQQ